MAIESLSARVARVIRSALDAKGMTQESLAEDAGIPMRTLARRLHPIHPSSLSVEELSVIAEALDLSMGDILATADSATAAVAS